MSNNLVLTKYFVERWWHLNVRVNFPDKTDLKANNILNQRIAQLDSVLIKRYLDNLELEDKSKSNVLKEVINFFSN